MPYYIIRDCYHPNLYKFVSKDIFFKDYLNTVLDWFSNFVSLHTDSASCGVCYYLEIVSNDYSSFKYHVKLSYRFKGGHLVLSHFQTDSNINFSIEITNVSPMMISSNMVLSLIDYYYRDDPNRSGGVVLRLSKSSSYRIISDNLS